MPQTHNESGAGADMFDLSNFDFEELIQWETTVCISTAMAPDERANVDQQQAQQVDGLGLFRPLEPNLL